MLGNEEFLALLREASWVADGGAADKLRRIVTTWFERRRRRTEMAADRGCSMVMTG